jgi:hypothetical protein
MTNFKVKSPPFLLFIDNNHVRILQIIPHI